MSEESREVMPRYNSRRQAWALKITGFSTRSCSEVYLLTDDERLPLIVVDDEYMTRYRPGIGGYFVMYSDGSQSYSSAKRFEAGYVLDNPEIDPNDMFVVVSSRDNNNSIRNGGSICWETYTDKSNLLDAIDRAKKSAGKYGESTICRLVPVGDVEFCEQIINSEQGA